MVHIETLGFFEWDSEKEEENIVKHHVNFQTAIEALLDPQGVLIADAKHSMLERRWLYAGKVRNQVVTVRTTFRGPKIRIFGAGVWRKGSKIYEKENPKTWSSF